MNVSEHAVVNTEASTRPLARFAWLTLAYNIAVILWGAYVRATGSGAGCGNRWPLCNGTVLPRTPQAQTIIEFTHRLTSGLAVVMVSSLLIWCWRKTSKGDWARYSSLAAILLLFNEALLGALLVLFEHVGQDRSPARAFLLCMHFGNTLLLLAALALTAHWLAKGRRRFSVVKNRAEIFAVAFGLLAIVCIGITGSVAALGDTLFPATSLMTSLIDDFSSGNIVLRLRFLHPVAAAIGTIYVLWLIVRNVKKPGETRSQVALAVVLVGQIGLGILNVVLLAPVWLQIVHLLVAELFWVLVVLASVTMIFPSVGSQSEATLVIDFTAQSDDRDELVREITPTALDPIRRSNEATDFEKVLRRNVVGQAQAISAVAEIYQMYLAGLNAPGRPVGNLLFLGPTGSGKTRVAEAIAQALYGNPDAVVKIDCAEFQHSHEIAKLIGSPPGYLGHRETRPLLCQEVLNQAHTDKVKLTVLLFDEIEKASDALWQLLLGILDKATLTLGDNRRVDLSRCIIIMTSNLGAREISSLARGGFGFAHHSKPVEEDCDEKIDRTGTDSARRKFSPEFMNRIDKVVVFKRLRAEHLDKILEIELGMVQQRILKAANDRRFVFNCTQPVKDFLLQIGTNPEYGARHLKRAIEQNLVAPLANIVASAQVRLGDFIRIDRTPEGNLTFTRELEGARVVSEWEPSPELASIPAMAARAAGQVATP